MDFVLVQNGKAMGPYSAEALRALIVQEEVKAHAKIWRSPWRNWTTVSAVFPSEFQLTPEIIDQADDASRNQPAESYLERLHRIVPMPEVQQMLREAKQAQGDEKEVRITAANKEKLVFDNVREAVAKGHLSQAEIVRLTREHEETGHQRIFLYEAAAGEELASIDIESLGSQIFGNEWAMIDQEMAASSAGEVHPASIRRYESAEGDATRSGWLLRLTTAISEMDRIDKNLAAASHLRTYTYAERLRPGVCVVRYWAQRGLLELRVPNFKRRGAVLESRDAVRSRLMKHCPAVARFQDWDLTKACTKLLGKFVQNPSSEPTLKSVSGTLMRERDRSTMRITLQAENTGLLKSQARRDAVERYLAENSVVEGLDVCFQLGVADSDFSVAIVPDLQRNEVGLSKVISAGEWDHVIVRLRENS